MTDSVHKGKTGATLKIPMQPFLLQVGFVEPVVCVGGAIPVQTLALNVADGAKVEYTFLDGQGSQVGTLQGKVYAGIHRGLFAVEKANATGFMTVVAELSDYGLKLAGPACKVTPAVVFGNLRWMDADGAKELDAVVRGQKVKLVADVVQGPSEGEAALTIRLVAADAAKAAKGSAPCHAHPPPTYKVSAGIRQKRIEALFRAEWDAPDRKSTAEFSVGLWGRSSQPSKKVRYKSAEFKFSE